MITLIAVEIKQEHDVVLARQRARQIATLLSFDRQNQSRITTAVSEVARNAFEYAGGGRVTFSVDANPARALHVRVTDHGRGIANLSDILAGRYISPTGMGLGLIGAKRLMDKVEIESNEQGTRILLVKNFPARPPQPPAHRLDLPQIAADLARAVSFSPFAEIQEQNQEMMRVLGELQSRQTELDELNRELADTNRGVMALYAELDEKAQQLQRANEMKTRFLSNVSHEFRTPLNSIIGLADLLLDRLDGPLTDEQEKQIHYIRQSAASLTEQVNDLLDTAKIESGTVTVDAREFLIADLFSSLRGMFRPLLSREVTLHFDDQAATALPPLFTDEGKVAQILRNFLSNALKFTEQGSIRVTVAPGPPLMTAPDAEPVETVVFAVSDDGIGIAPEDQARIFEDFGQVDSDLQRRVKGTGLGLPLTRRLAGILGGTIRVTSVAGAGSTFTATLPCCYAGALDILKAGGQGGFSDD